MKADSGRVLLVEDDPDAAAMLARQLADEGYASSVAATAVEALRLPNRESFVLALVDISLGGELDGVDVAEWLVRLYGIPVIFATSAIDDDVLIRARKVKPAGYLVKPIEPSQLHSAVVLATGRVAAQPTVVSGADQDLAFLRRQLERIREVVDETRFAERVVAKQPGHLPRGLESLSAREWQIMRDLTRTPSAETIAAQRHISVHTVQNHLKSVYRKLNVHSTAELLTLLLTE
jgi:DNA-binding NarL/FixJ family response regulator